MTIKLEHFVDRQELLGLVQEVTARQRSERIILVGGRQDMGKTFLLEKRRDGCRQEQVAHVWIEFAEHAGQDYHTIIEESWAQLGPAGFEPLREAIERMGRVQAGQPPDWLGQLDTQQVVQAAAAAMRSESRPGEGARVGGNVSTAGGDFIGRDQVRNYISIVVNAVQGADTEKQADLLRGHVVGVFRDCLAQITRQRQVVFFVDAWHLLDNAVLRDWLLEKLLAWIRDDELPLATAVISFRHDFPPAFRRDRTLEAQVVELKSEFALQYLMEMRGCSEALAREIHEAVDGHPGLLRSVADYRAPSQVIFG